jgi:hypothetical protein
MKILWSKKFKFEDSLKGLLDLYAWQKTNLPIKITLKAVNLIVSLSITFKRKGFIQCHGRDHCMRPCIILRFAILSNEIVSTTS